MEKKYIVNSLSVAGRQKKIFRSGDIITAHDLGATTNIELFIRRGFISEFSDVPVEPLKPIPFGNGKMKVAFCSAVWKRPEIFELFAKGIHQLKKEITDIDFEIIIAGSEGLNSQAMVAKHGFHYIEVPNDPLATKHNKTTQLAGKLNCDFVLCLGSDDIIHPGLMRKYIQYMKEGYDYIGVLDFYFYDTVTKKTSYWGGYRDERRKNHTCGAGRILSKRLLSCWNFTPWEIKDSKVLDNSMQHKLRKTPHSIKTFSIKDEGVFGLDIKSSTNMTPFDLWDNTKYISPDIIKQNFDYLNL